MEVATRGLLLTARQDPLKCYALYWICVLLTQFSNWSHAISCYSKLLSLKQEGKWATCAPSCLNYYTVTYTDTSLSRSSALDLLVAVSGVWILSLLFFYRLIKPLCYIPVPAERGPWSPSVNSLLAGVSETLLVVSLSSMYTTSSTFSDLSFMIARVMLLLGNIE